MFNPALIAPVFVCAHLSIGAPVEWLAPVSGSWEDGMNWSGGIAPGSAVDDVYLLHETAYDVTINQAQLSRSLQITNPQAGLQIADGASLTLFGGIENNGTIIINPSSGQNGASVQAILDAEINGSGVLRLNGQQRGHARLNGSGIELTHGADHTIEGAGWVYASRIANLGTIATRPDRKSVV